MNYSRCARDLIVIPVNISVSADVALNSSTGTAARKSKAAKAKGSNDVAKPPRRAKLPRTSSSTLVTLSSSQARPNMSRRLPFENVIVAFPSFDKCDSLVYFPSSFTRLLNNGDMPALWKLFVAHLDKNCDIVLANCFRFREHKLGPFLFLKSYELLNELQPDRIMCVDATKVEENRINASIHMKFTDCQAIYDSVARNVIEPQLKHMVPADRKDALRYKISTTDKTAEEKSGYEALVDSGVDLLLYIHLFMDITFDDASRKIKKLHFHGSMTSLHATDTTVMSGGL